MNILIVDDEKEIVDLIALYLRNEGYTIYPFYDATQVLSFLETHSIDLAILDIMMPGIDGFALCEQIRMRYSFPILFVSAKVEQMDKINGFALGADDYITKPFTPVELVARVKANLRRYTTYNVGNRDMVIDFKNLSIDYMKREVFLNGNVLSLTPKEFEILYYLCKNRGRVVSTEELYKAVWKDKFLPTANNTIMVHIRHLCEKMNDSSERPQYIKTVWGIGYEMEES